MKHSVKLLIVLLIIALGSCIPNSKKDKSTSNSTDYNEQPRDHTSLQDSTIYSSETDTSGLN
jgi:hypothetical protein